MAKRALTLADMRAISERQKQKARSHIDKRIEAIVIRVCDAAEGIEGREMTREQLKAAEMIIARAIPAKTEHETTVTHQHSVSDETIRLLRLANEKLAGRAIVDNSVNNPVDNLTVLVDKAVDNSDRIAITNTLIDMDTGEHMADCVTVTQVEVIENTGE